MTRKSKTMCDGCRDDYYNRNREEGCWTYGTAYVVKRVKVGIWQPPPYSWNPQEVLSCHNPDGYVWLKEDDPRVVS
jgi:hypothetical protein